jgi:hypothetical protein
MKKLHILFVALVLTTINAQTVVNFTAEEGFTNNIPLYNQTGWSSSFSGSTWLTDTENENINTDTEYARVAWGQEFYHGTTGDEITFRVELNFSGSYNADFSNVGLLQIGFSTTSDVEADNPTAEWIYLRSSAWDEKIYLSTTIGSSGLTTPVRVTHPNDNDEFAAEVTLTLGTDAASSTFSAKLINLTTSEESNVGSYGNIDADVFNAATIGLYGYLKSDNFKNAGVGTLETIRVTKVQMTGGTHNFTNVSGDGEWSTATNWTKSSVPTSSTLVTIKNGQSTTINSVDSAVKDLQVDSGGSLTIAKNSDFTISGNFTNNGTVTLNSDADEFASIIVGGTSSGDIIYNRYVNTQGTDEWDLIGAPVDGLSISSFVTANSSPLAASGSTYAVGVYDNSDGSWTNYTSSTVGAAGNFDIGKGYQMATASGATMAFTGTIATTDQTQSIINNAGSGGSRWNLVANPYPSYLNANTSAHATNNFLSVNSGVIDNSYLAVYGYDADGTGYTIYNNTSSATHIAPGQAFFVAAASSSSASLSFTEAMQTTTGGDDFIVGLSANTSSTFYLKLYEDQDFIADTRFYFDSNLTLGLDPGYDAGSLSQSTTIGSRLVEEDQGITIGINAMGIDSLEEVTIPLVINRAAGVAFRVSLEGATIPQGTKVYLEDTQQATFTDLRAGDFTLNPQSELSGMGRFYLRLGSIALSVDELEDSNISVYKQKAEKHITIEGLDNVTKASVKLYNLLGQELLRQDLEANIPTQKISTAGITTGVYVVKLSVNGKKITKKVIVD